MATPRAFPPEITDCDTVVPIGGDLLCQTCSQRGRRTETSVSTWGDCLWHTCSHHGLLGATHVPPALCKAWRGCCRGVRVWMAWCRRWRGMRTLNVSTSGVDGLVCVVERFTSTIFPSASWVIWHGDGGSSITLPFVAEVHSLFFSPSFPLLIHSFLLFLPPPPALPPSHSL